MRRATLLPVAVVLLGLLGWSTDAKAQVVLGPGAISQARPVGVMDQYIIVPQPLVPFWTLYDNPGFWYQPYNVLDDPAYWGGSVLVDPWAAADQSYPPQPPPEELPERRFTTYTGQRIGQPSRPESGFLRPQMAREWQQHLTEARLAFRRGNYEEAAQQAYLSAQQMPSDPRPYELVSLALLMQGEYEQAAQYAQQFVALGGRSFWASVRGYFGNEDAYLAQLSALEDYVRDQPGAADAQFLLGYHYHLRGDLDRAEEQLSRALEQSPDNAQATRLLNDVERAQQRERF